MITSILTHNCLFFCGEICDISQLIVFCGYLELVARGAFLMLCTCPQKHL